MLHFLILLLTRLVVTPASEHSQSSKSVWKLDACLSGAGEGLGVLELPFEDVRERLCDSVRRTLARLPGWPDTCTVFHSPHTRTSHHKLSLEHRAGANVRNGQDQYNSRFPFL